MVLQRFSAGQKSFVIAKYVATQVTDGELCGLSSPRGDEAKNQEKNDHERARATKKGVALGDDVEHYGDDGRILSRQPQLISFKLANSAEEAETVL